MQSFDQRDGWIWYNGEMVPWREAKVHVLTHALHYGSSVFEGTRAYNGRAFKIKEHMDRLVFSGRTLGFELPYDVAELIKATADTLKENNITDGYLRHIAWRGPEQIGISAQRTKIHVAIAAWEWPSYFTPEQRAKGLRLRTSEWRRPAPNTAPCFAKAAGLYMICTHSKHAAEAAGYDDALMLDWRGLVAEATGANIFLVKNQEIHTPTPDCFLNGITRQTVIQLAGQLGYQIIERAIWPHELGEFDECFLTGTAAELTPVGQIDNVTFQVGPASLQLVEAYSKLVRQI